MCWSRRKTGLFLLPDAKKKQQEERISAFCFASSFFLTLIHTPLHLPLNASRHIGHVPALTFGCAGTIEIVGKGEHEITLKYNRTGIQYVVGSGHPGNALVLVQDVVNRKFDLPVLLFKYLQSQAAVPQRNVLVKSIRTAGVDEIIKVGRQYQAFEEGH